MPLNRFTIQKNFAISAGAGSGKTYTLSRRYINALLGFDYFREDYDIQQSYFESLRPARVRQIVTITYTEAAALEMKGRIFELIGKVIDPNLSENDEDFSSIARANAALESDDQRKYVVHTLKRAFRESAHARISTIHAFCLDIIRANADIARTDMRLDIIKDDERAKLLSDIVFEVLNSETYRETVLEITEEISMYFINALIEKYISSAKFRNDYESFSKESISLERYKALILELYPLPEVTDEIWEEIARAGDAEVRGEWFETYLENFAKFDAKPWKSFTVASVYKSGAKKGQEKIAALSLGPKKFPCLNAFKEEADKLVPYYAPVDEAREALFFEKVEKIKTLLREIKARYDAILKERGKTDFDTIIEKASQIIPQIDTDFRYIMVDEFQDTNQTQFEIVRAAKGEDTNLFVVGDSKQSIYAFQGAEIEVFNRAVHDMVLFDVAPVDMSTNYRSDGVVLETVNRIFEQLLCKEENLRSVSRDFEARPQALYVAKKKREEKGSFRYLITPQPYRSKEEREEQGDGLSEMETIAQFVSEICRHKRAEYLHISKLVSQKKQAIAILFDSSTRMLELKQRLKARGIACKVSASDNFYHTAEINDIFNVLKAIEIHSSKKPPWSQTDRYYLAGAMRSNILRVKAGDIKRYLDRGEVDEKLAHYAGVLPTLSLSQGVKYIYDDANIYGVYTHLDDVEQRVANLYKFLMLCREYEEEGETTLYGFLSLIENAVYFSEAKEDEAFYLSGNTTSIELCTIHATKGLAYPMVVLANADKGLYSQISSDALKHNNFTMDGERKEIVGFRIGDYTPLSHRVLKRIDKMKHLAEKKRLLYVALTRAKHDVVISALLKTKQNGTLSLREDSYLSMIAGALEIDLHTLFERSHKACIIPEENGEAALDNTPVRYVEHRLEPLDFAPRTPLSATSGETEKPLDLKAAERGTILHRIIELYWERFFDHQDAILDRMGVLEEQERDRIVAGMRKFYDSFVYKALKQGAEAYFEKEFDDTQKRGSIDLCYFDPARKGWVIVDFKTGRPTGEKESTYRAQLDFYRKVMEEQGYSVVETALLWL